MDSVKNILHHNKHHHTDGAHGTATTHHTEHPVENPTAHEGTAHREGTHHSHHAGEAAATAGAYEAERHHHGHPEGGLGHEHHVPSTGAAAAAVPDLRPEAEVGNNFPGTNPHPDQTALGTTAGKGLAFSGRQ